MRAKRAVFRAPHEPIEVRECDVTSPAPGEILVQVDLAGVCGTDAHRIRGDLPVPPEPISFGHEAVGTVVDLAAGVSTDAIGQKLSVGDRVYWAVSGTCGRCYSCTVLNNPLLCASPCWPPVATEPNAAGFQEFATLDARVPTFRIPGGTSIEAVIALGCALPTALGGFRRLGAVQPGASIVIQGAGPVGLACAVLAGMSSAQHVIVIGDEGARLDAARRVGATDVLSLADSPAERADALRELTDGRGADVVIEAAGHISAFDEGLNLLAADGRYLILGLYSGNATVPFNPVLLNNLNLTVLGSLGADPRDYLNTVRIVQRHGERLELASLVTHRFALEEIAEAVSVLGTGNAVKPVVAPRARPVHS